MILKDHVTLKTEVLMQKMQLYPQMNKFNYILEYIKIQKV